MVSSCDGQKIGGMVILSRCTDLGNHDLIDHSVG
jgi:hypothetical protein